jgi:putative ABC transport system permease protein
MNKRPLATRIYRQLLRVFPFDFQREYGSEMESVFRQEHRYAAKTGVAQKLNLWWLTLRGFLKTAPMEHLDVLRRDIFYGLRSLRKSPGFTLGAITALAIGIGANLTIFGFANALLFRPLPAPNADELVRVSMYSWGNVPYDHYIKYRDGNRTFSGLAAFQGAGANIQFGNTPELAIAMLVSGNYFDCLRIPAALGRTIAETDDRLGAPGVVMLSDGYWRRRFAASPSVIGTKVTIDGSPFTIIGVTPASFNGTMAPLTQEIWIPWNGPHRDIPFGVALVGRLRSGVAIEQARADLGATAANIAQEINQHFYLTVSAARVLHPELVPPVAVFSGLMLALAGLVLLIACLNIASLLLARSTARRREIGVRIAIGASRTQLIRQLLTESLLLSIAGGMFGLGIAIWLGSILGTLRLPSPVPVPIVFDFVVDWHLVLFAVVISFGTTVLFGLAPALQSVKADIAMSLRDGSAAAGLSKSRVRAVFVVGQLGVSTLLLVTAMLLVRSLTSAQITNRGFVAENVLTVSMNLVNSGYTKERGIDFYNRLVRRLESTPGITSASVAEIVPLTASSAGRLFFRDEGTSLEVSTNSVSSGHFRTLDIPLLAGRDFTDADREGAALVCIINQRLGQRFWPGENAVGKRLRSGPTQWTEVVGIAADSKYVGLGEFPKFFLYQPIAQHYPLRGQASLLIKTKTDPMSGLPAVRTAVQELDPSVAVFGINPLDKAAEISLLPIRIASAFASALGIVALLLGATGIYSVVSYLARNRTREIGIRIALGAKPSQVVRFVTSEAIRWITVGLVIGFVAALGIAQLIKNLIYGVPSADPVSFFGVGVILCATACAACWIPARRATKVDPTVALREE